MSELQGDLKSLRELFGSALQQASVLLSNEMSLARAEVSEKIAQAGRGGAMVVAGAVMLMPALTLILFAIAAGVATLGFTPAVAYLITGAGAAVLAGLVIAVGMGRLSGEKLKPRTTINQMRRDGDAVREMVR
jgi:hypothetical protein